MIFLILLDIYFQVIAMDGWFIAEKHEEKKIKLIGPAVESCYGELEKHSDRDQTFDNFYQALCETVEYNIISPPHI